MNGMGEALALGLISSIHCLGMCGPIALALPIHQESPLKKSALLFFYHLGRIITYTLLGLLAGSIGQYIIPACFNRWVSIATGGIMLLIVLYPYLNLHLPSFRFLNFGFHRRLIQKAQPLFREKKTPIYFLLGMLNGLLPCGPLYLAITASIGFSIQLPAFVFMFLYGLGTVPALLILYLGIHSLKTEGQKRWKKISPIAYSLVAVLLIFRGLNLGIPYLSPLQKNGKIQCCEGKTEEKHPAIMRCPVPK